MTSLVDTNDCPPVTSTDVLFAAFDRFQEEGTRGAAYLRGQAKASWGLVPSIGRKGFYRYGSSVIDVFSKEQDFKLLDRFRRYAHSHVGRILKPWEALFLARHHGLPVRLLDWTSNPLVALFNAVEDARHVKKDGAVWLLRRKADTTDDVRVVLEDVDPLTIRGVRMLYPSYVSPRLVVQSGCFTTHEYPWTDLVELDTSSFSPADLDIERLKKLIVPYDRKPELLKYLMRAAINSRTLFPDLDGLAKGLWELEVIRERG